MSNDPQYDGEDPADEVMQDVTPDEPIVVPVQLVEPPTVRQLPRLGAGYSTVTVDTVGARILAGDPRRAEAVLLSVDQPMYVGQTAGTVNARVGTPTGMYWPAGVPYVVSHRDEVWVSSVASTSRISVAQENWAH